MNGKRPLKVLLVTLFRKELKWQAGLGVIKYGLSLSKNIKKYGDFDFEDAAIFDFRGFLYLLRVGLSSIVRRKFDVIHFTEPTSVLFWTWIRTKKRIVNVHDYVPFNLGAGEMKKYSAQGFFVKPFETLLRPFFGFWAYLFIKAGMNLSDKIICISDETLKNLVKFGGVYKNKCVVVPPIVEPIPIHKKQSKKTIIGHASSYALNKNVGVLLSAFEKVGDPNLELHLYGSHFPYRITDKRIKYFGFVDEKTLEKAYNSFSVFILPSIWEGFGLPIIEAKSCKVPVVVYAKGEIPKAVKKDTIGFSDEKDLVEIIKSRAWSKINLEKAYKDSLLYGPEKIVNQLKSVYTDGI